MKSIYRINIRHMMIVYSLHVARSLQCIVCDSATGRVTDFFTHNVNCFTCKLNITPEVSYFTRKTNYVTRYLNYGTSCSPIVVQLLPYLRFLPTPLST